MNKIKFFKYKDHIPTRTIDGGVMYDATAMAKPFGKQPDDWLELKETKVLWSMFSTSRQLSLAELVHQEQDEQSSPRTWMRKDAIVIFSLWLSPAFGVWFNACVKCTERQSCRSWKGFFWSFGDWTISKLSSRTKNDEYDSDSR